MARRSLDEMFAALAAAQVGVVGIEQAERLGFGRSMIRHRLDAGRWIRVRRGVVRAAGSPPTWEADLISGWLVVGRRAVIGRGAAACLLGLDGVGREPSIEFVGERGSGNARSGLLVHHTRTLDPIDVVVRRRTLTPSVRRDRGLRKAGLVTSFRATSASRTIIDLAPHVGSNELAALVDSACRLGFSSPAFLARRLEAMRRPGRAGLTALDQALFDSGGHTMLERALLRALRAAGLPKPRCQVVHTVDRHRIGRVDFDFDPHRLIVEVNGAKGHASDPDRAKDAHRRNELQQLGFVVLEFTYSQVIGDPEGTVTTIAAVLRKPL